MPSLGYADSQLTVGLPQQMLFTWDTKNLCIVFRQWHVRGTTSLIFSLLAVVIIAMGYEGLRSLSAKYERAVNKRIEAMPRKSAPRLHMVPTQHFVFATV